MKLLRIQVGQLLQANLAGNPIFFLAGGKVILQGQTKICSYPAVGEPGARQPGKFARQISSAPNGMICGFTTGVVAGRLLGGSGGEHHVLGVIQNMGVILTLEPGRESSRIGYLFAQAGGEESRQGVLSGNYSGLTGALLNFPGALQYLFIAFQEGIVQGGIPPDQGISNKEGACPLPGSLRGLLARKIQLICRRR